ncbi:RAB37 protein, partial [Columbina picui]|nr:RAB37 protein [Columbina picui]
QVMLLGDSGVGKTCFLLQFKDGAFLSGTFIATVGIDFRVRPPQLPAPHLPQPTPWPGQGAGKGEQGVSSLGAPNNLPTGCKRLLKLSTSSWGSCYRWKRLLGIWPWYVLTLSFPWQADVSSERAVRTEDGASLAREYGVPFMETSAKTGMNVELAFLAVAKELKQRAVQPLDEPRFQIHDYIESQKKKSSCCAFA